MILLRTSDLYFSCIENWCMVDVIILVQNIMYSIALKMIMSTTCTVNNKIALWPKFFENFYFKGKISKIKHCAHTCQSYKFCCGIALTTPCLGYDHILNMCNNKHNMLIGLHIICWLELDYDRPHNYPVFTNTITEYLVLGGYVIYILRFTAKLVRYLYIYSAKSSAGRAAAVPWLCFCGCGSTTEVEVKKSSIPSPW